MWNMINYAATAMTLTLSRLAEENPDVGFIFNLPGLVPTDIHANSILGKWYGRWLVNLIGISVEDAGERSVFLLTSTRLGGKGVSGEGKVLTMKKKWCRGRCFLLMICLRGFRRRTLWLSCRNRTLGVRFGKGCSKCLPHTCKDGSSEWGKFDV
jgi:hypothetical protein